MSADVEAVARDLRTARARAAAISPVWHRLPRGDVKSAYAVQDLNARAREAAGARRVGRKIGLTNPVVQAQFGVGQPDYGVLFDDMAVSDDGVLGLATMIAPRVEAEIAFILRSDILDISVEAVRDAVGWVSACLEIVDSRVLEWDIDIVDTIADNASSAYFVVGRERVALRDLEPRDAVMTLYCDGVEVSSGRGTDSMGDPLEALAWLAKTALGNGAPLRSGEVVLSGSLGRIVPLAADSTFRSEVSGLGSVTLNTTGV